MKKASAGVFVIERTGRRARFRRSGSALRGLLAMTAASLFLPALAACGSSSSGSGSAKTVTFGVMAPFTGPFAQAGSDLMKGVNLAKDQINAAGGINGAQLQLVTGDTASDPTDAASAESKLLNVDKVPVIIGPRTITGPTVIKQSERARVPQFIVGGSTSLDKSADKYFWRTTASDSQQGTAMADYAIKQKFTTAALVFEKQPAAQTLKAPITDAYQKHSGQLVATVDIAPNQTSYRSEVQQIFAQHPQTVFFQVSSATAGVLFPEIKQAGFLTVPFIGTNTTSTSDFFSAIGPDIAKSVISTQSSAPSGQGRTHYEQLFSAKYNSKQVANLSADIYDAMIIAALAMDKSGTLSDSKAINDAVTKVSNPPGTVVNDYASGLKAIQKGQKVNYEGAAGSQDFDQYHNTFGPFDALKFAADGSTQVVLTMSAHELAGF
jgi:ABC-type branched-subunit amino acid transport system substrate-binding protein